MRHDTRCGEDLFEAKGVEIATSRIRSLKKRYHYRYAPSPTENSNGRPNSEMHQPKKGKHSYYGLKAHIGIDAEEGTFHWVVTTAFNELDCRVLPHLLHGEEHKRWEDCGYQGRTEAIKEDALKASNKTCRNADARTKWTRYSV